MGGNWAATISSTVPVVFLRIIWGCPASNAAPPPYKSEATSSGSRLGVEGQINGGVSRALPWHTNTIPSTVGGVAITQLWRVISIHFVALMGFVVTKVGNGIYTLQVSMLDITELEFPVVLRWEQECRLVPWLSSVLIKEVVFSGIQASGGLCGHLIVNPEECMTEGLWEIPEFFTLWKQALSWDCIPIKRMEAEKILAVAL